MSKENIDNEAISGERSSIGQQEGQRNSSNLARRGAVVAAVVVGASILGWSTLKSDKSDDDAAPKKVVVKQNNAFEPAPPPKPQAVPVTEDAITLPLPDAPTKTAEKKEDPLLDAAQRAPVLAFSGGGSRLPSGGAGKAGDPYVTMPGEQDPDATKFNNMMKPTVLQGAKAGYLGNRNYVVAMGTSIPCVLETALSSDQPGFTSCVINRDIMSDNGRVVLMEKGTQVVGEYRGGLKRGQSRLFVLWTRAKTPKGVIITLASPATDAVGRAGFDGFVDTHFMERFGSALLLSVVGDLTTFAGQQLSNSDVTADNTSNSGKQAAAIAVEQSINIPPTLLKHQGSLVNIFVARDLDFSDIYQLKVTEPQNRVFDRAVQGDFFRHPDVVTK